MAFGLSVAGCDCSDPLPPSLTFVRPTNGARLSLADDADMVMAGVQYDVRLSASGIASGEAVSLMLDPSLTGMGGSMLASSAVAADGSVTIRATLPSGDHSLVARSASSNIQSNVVNYTLADTCGTITFIHPTPSGTMGGRITLGPSDDTDGVACGDTFQTTVEVSTDAGNGATARLMVNGTPRGMTTVAGTIASFANVGLDNRGTSANTIAVEIRTVAGVTCTQDFPGQVFVDCEGASCAITSPTGATGYLNAADDSSGGMAGFQDDFAVTTDESGLGQPISLIIDGDESGAMMMTPVPSGMGGVATFGNVSLSEGSHRFRARCLDAAGNTALSSEVTWIVDTIACGVVVDFPVADEFFTPLDDADTVTAGTQIDYSATVSGADCDAARVALCSGIMGASFTPFTGTSLSGPVTLSDSAMQELCGEVRDTAGNIGEGRVAIRYRSDSPQLQIATPATGTSFNVMGDATHTADLDTASTACDARFEVYCTDVGSPVTLHPAGSTVALAPDANCVADASVPAGYNGRATFMSVALASIPSGATFNIVASQTVDGLTGNSDPVSLTADCEPPTLTVTRPTCGSILRPSTQDEDSSTAGFQYRVVVANPPTGVPCPTLRVLSGGSALMPLPPAGVATGVFCSYTFADFNTGGMLEIRAELVDSFGNLGFATCPVTVQDLPTLSITTPLNGTVLGAGDDCNAGAPGLQLRVRATTDAPPGSAATVRIGTLTTVMTTVSGGVIDVCTDAPEGAGLPVAVSVTDARGTASAMSTVTIDSLPPTMPISTLAVGAVTDVRRGCVTLSWTAVADAGGGALSRYRLRCASSGILSEPAWSAGTVRPVTITPGTGGTAESDIICGFRPGELQHCTLRAEDVTDALTPIGNDVTVQIDLRRQDVGVPTGAFAVGLSVAGVGDVNGDGIDDVLAGGNGRAVLYFGNSTALPSAASVTFVGASGVRFGYAVAGIGDFNGDGRNDIAISAPFANGLAGDVYVFYGRASWLASYDLTLGGCRADICIHGDDGTPGTGPDESGWLGYGLEGVGDFNGDGRADFAIGAPGANGFVGRFYVVLGAAVAAGSDRSLPGILATRLDGFYGDGSASVKQVGVSLAGLGLALGSDSFSDIVIGAPGDGTAPGRVFVVAGRAHPGPMTGLSGIGPADQVLVDTGAGSAYGAFVTNVGDYDSNGQVDLAVWDSTGAGSVSVYLLSSGTYSAASRVMLSGAASGDSFGWAIALGRHPVFGGRGDLDRDGIADLCIGSRNLSSTAPGAVFGYYGRSVPTSSAWSDANYQLRPPSSAAVNARRRPQYVGDINGDTYPDIAVGDSAEGSGDGRLIIYY